MNYIIGSHQHTDSGPHKHTRHPEGPEQSPLGPGMGFSSMPLSRGRCDSCNWEGVLVPEEGGHVGLRGAAFRGRLSPCPLCQWTPLWVPSGPGSTQGPTFWCLAPRMWAA